jgi:hypothetical protein
MFTPTLASALYVMLLRFLHRDYNEVVRLGTCCCSAAWLCARWLPDLIAWPLLLPSAVNTCGTDTEFSAEEQHIFNALVRVSSLPCTACL